MSAISWPTTVPSPSSAASSGDDAFRSLVTSFALGVSTSFVWPGSGGGSTASAGESVLGNARFAISGTTATVGGVGDGFLLLNTDRVSLHHIGSTWTGLLGHSGMLDRGSAGTAPFTYRWLTQTGITPINSTGTSNVTWPTPYSVAPTVIVSNGLLNEGAGLGNFMCIQLGSITTSGCTVLTTITNTGSIIWRSDGTVLI